MPFGLNRRMQNAWWLEGGGELMNAFYAKYNIYGAARRQHDGADGRLVPQGDQHHRRPEGRQDAHRRLCRRGDRQAWRTPQQIAGRDIYPALEKGTVDAAEWVGPHDDEKLGLHKVAKYYYYPGWWEGEAMLHVQVNNEKWEALPKSYQAILKAAAAHAHKFMVGRYDALNPVALKKILAAGHAAATVLGVDPGRVLQGCQRGLRRDQRQERGLQEALRGIKAFRADQYLWLQLADNTYDNYMMIQQRKKTL